MAVCQQEVYSVVRAYNISYKFLFIGEKWKTGSEILNNPIEAGSWDGLVMIQDPPFDLCALSVGPWVTGGNVFILAQFSSLAATEVVQIQV